MDITLSIDSPELDQEEIHELTRHISNKLNDEVDNAGVKLLEQEGQIGTKGDPLTIGTIILTLIGSGGVAVSLINVLKSYVDRKDTIVIKIKSKNGDEVEINANNLSATQINETIKKTTKLVDKVLGVGSE